MLITREKKANISLSLGLVGFAAFVFLMIGAGSSLDADGNFVPSDTSPWYAFLTIILGFLSLATLMYRSVMWWAKQAFKGKDEQIEAKDRIIRQKDAHIEDLQDQLRRKRRRK